MKRKIPGNKCGCCCTLKEKLNTLWNRAIGCINKVNEITPDGDGKFTVEAGDNILLTEISNGMRISTTGGISYYSAGDTYIDIDNNDLEISLVNPGQSGGVALHDDLDTVATALSDLLNGGTVGSDTKPVKIVSGVATPVTDDLIADKVTTSVIDISSLPNYVGGSIIKATIGSHLIIYSFQDVIFSAATGAVVIDTLPSNVLNSPRAILGTLSGVQGIAYAFYSTSVNMNITGIDYATGQMIVII